MNISNKKKGFVVELSLKPDWGRGTLRSVAGRFAIIVFENDPERLPRKFPVDSPSLTQSANQAPVSFKSANRKAGSGRPKKNVQVEEKATAE
jgi:hypothetical protein